MAKDPPAKQQSQGIRSEGQEDPSEKEMATSSGGPGGNLHCRGGGKVTSYRGIGVRWAHQLPGKPVKSTPLTAPLLRTITSWGLGQVGRKVHDLSGEAGTGQARDVQRAREQPS